MQIHNLTPIAGFTLTGVPKSTVPADARNVPVGSDIVVKPVINAGHNGRCCLQIDVGTTGTDPSWNLEGRLDASMSWQVVTSGTASSAGVLVKDLTILPEMRFNVTANPSTRAVHARLKHDGV